MLLVDVIFFFPEAKDLRQILKEDHGPFSKRSKEVHTFPRVRILFQASYLVIRAFFLQKEADFVIFLTLSSLITSVLKNLMFEKLKC